MNINKLQIIGLLLLVLLLASPVLAGTGTITIWGTNVSTAQANVTIIGAPYNVTVTGWVVNGIKTITVNVTNVSGDNLTLYIANNSINKVAEFLVNGSAINGVMVNATGVFEYTYTQAQGVAIFTIRPAVNQGGFNTVWAYIQYLTVVVQTTINNVVITNTSRLNVTNIAGNGSEISQLNASNLTGSLPAINGSAIFGLNMSNQTRCTGNMTCTYQANGSMSLDATSNITAIFNQIQNTSTVKVSRMANNSIELTATVATGTSLSSSSTNYTAPDSSLSVGDTSQNTNIEGFINYVSINTTTAMNVTSIDIYIYSKTVGAAIRGAIYTNTTGRPGNLIIETQNQSTVNVGWNNISLTNPVYLNSNTRYWIAVQETGATVNYKDITPTASYTEFQAYGTFPATATTGVKTGTTPYIGILSSPRAANLQYTNSNNTNSLLIQVTLLANTTTGGSRAVGWCMADSSSPPATRISGQIGINNGMVNEEYIEQLTCVIPPAMNYAINTSTYPGGNLTWTDWREIII